MKLVEITVFMILLIVGVFTLGAGLLVIEPGINEDVLSYEQVTISNANITFIMDFENHYFNIAPVNKTVFMSAPQMEFNTTFFRTGSVSTQSNASNASKNGYVSLNNTIVNDSFTLAFAIRPVQYLYYDSGNVSSDVLNVSVLSAIHLTSGDIHIQHIKDNTSTNNTRFVYLPAGASYDQGVYFACAPLNTSEWNTVVARYNKTSGQSALVINNNECLFTMPPNLAITGNLSLNEDRIGGRGVFGQYDCAMMVQSLMSNVSISEWHDDVTAGTCPTSGFTTATVSTITRERSMFFGTGSLIFLVLILIVMAILIRAGYDKLVNG